MPAVEVQHFTKRYRRVVTLDDVSFTVRPGEVLGLIGPNGSGKTTLFECLAGVLPADGGEITTDGRRLTGAERTATLFYLPDSVAPWPAQTVRWALDFVAGFFVANGAPEGGALQRRGDSAIEPFDLAPILDTRIGALSKGQRERALLAMAFLTPQPVLLADEPFEGLDLRQTRDVAAALRRHAAAGRTLVLSIHQIADAARICDRFVLLSGGRVRGEGTLDQLRAAAGPRSSPPNLEEVFLALT